MRKTKFNDVLNHLKAHRSITQKEAIKYYGAYRLSDIVFKLRKAGYNILTVNESAKDRNGNTCTYARYVLKAQ